MKRNTIAIFLLLLALCSFSQNNTSAGSSPQDSLDKIVKKIYLNVLRDYFTDTVGNNDIKKYGFNFVVSDPHAFDNSFSVNGKPFHFKSPPYHDLFVMNIATSKIKKGNAGRHAYFIYSNKEWLAKTMPDTLKITFYEYVFTGREGRKGNSSQWEENKVLLREYHYTADKNKLDWNETKRIKTTRKIISQP